jgi:hypothetical protein
VVEDEHNQMVKHPVWQAVKIVSSAWAMKKKANGTFCTWLNARGYKQVNGIHYDSHNISAAVTNNVKIWFMLTLMIMAK